MNKNFMKMKYLNDIGVYRDRAAVYDGVCGGGGLGDRLRGISPHGRVRSQDHPG